MWRTQTQGPKVMQRDVEDTDTGTTGHAKGPKDLQRDVENMRRDERTSTLRKCSACTEQSEITLTFTSAVRVEPTAASSTNNGRPLMWDSVSVTFNTTRHNTHTWTHVPDQSTQSTRTHATRARTVKLSIHITRDIGGKGSASRFRRKYKYTQTHIIREAFMKLTLLHNIKNTHFT